MPLPASFNTGTIKGQYFKLDGSPQMGSVSISPTVDRLIHPVEDLIITPATYTAYLDSVGAFSVVLPATDDPDIATDFQYIILESFENGKEYMVDLPVGSILDLSDITYIL